MTIPPRPTLNPSTIAAARAFAALTDPTAAARERDVAAHLTPTYPTEITGAALAAAIAAARPGDPAVAALVRAMDRADGCEPAPPTLASVRAALVDHLAALTDPCAEMTSWPCDVATAFGHTSPTWRAQGPVSTPTLTDAEAFALPEQRPDSFVRMALPPPFVPEPVTSWRDCATCSDPWRPPCPVRHAEDPARSAERAAARALADTEDATGTKPNAWDDALYSPTRSPELDAEPTRCDPATGTHVTPHRGCILR